MNPFDTIEQKLDQKLDQIEKAVTIAVLRELARIVLSRLNTLDSDNSGDYLNALSVLR